MKRIHVQHILLTLQPGGLENGLVQVINGLDEQRFTSSVCCLATTGTFAGRIRRLNAPVHEMGLGAGPDFLLPFQLTRVLRQTRPDIVHTHNVRALYYGWAAARLARVKAVVHSEHGSRLLGNKLQVAVRRCMVQSTRRTFAVSDQLRRDLIDHLFLAATQVEVIRNGVDVDRMMSGDRAAGRKRIGAEPPDFVIGSVARLDPVKNLQLLLRAVRGMSNQERIKVALIGEGPERSRLQDLAAQLGLGPQVCLLGHREDIPDLLAALDVFVLPSVSEGMSHALLEAMAAARPVLASAVRGNIETLGAPDHGLLFASGDEKALRALLNRLANNPELRTRIGTAAQNRVRRHFNIQSMVLNHAKMYEEALCSPEEKVCAEDPRNPLFLP